MFSSIATAPAKQSVGETINVLSGRLSSATLLEDRRAAILGLRSFAKEYPASVASGALRSLIGSLSKDGEDVDTVKVVLETLLMLFSPNENSPEASDEIVLWLADEFTQRQENITLLLDFLETSDFYSRLYSLQLLSSILSTRTDRTEKCIFAAPLGISRLVAVLDDRREAVRNEAISLLTYLTPTNPDIQKLVAFENAIEKLFAIIMADGGLSEGDRVVEDCLILLANLLRLNTSNQAFFRGETRYIKQLAKLLEGSYELGKEADEVAQWAQQQRNRNIYALLAVLRLFLIPKAVGCLQNQDEFWKHNVLYHALQLGFNHAAELPIRAEALTTCADIIRENPKLQESFAQLQVPSVFDAAPPIINGQGKTNGIQVQFVYVIDGLLDLTLSIPATPTFDLRLAACQCLKAYFYKHDQIRLHFLRRAIDGHTAGGDETANVLTTVLQPSSSSTSNDPYRQWFAAVVLLHLVYESPEAKALAMSVTEGDAESGEEVVTSIQIITAHLISSLKDAVDERIIIGYLMLLIGWLFEDLDGVNDFLGEGSNIQPLAEAAQHSANSGLVQGMCAMILGIVYEFSTKDSPIPRATLKDVLLSRLTREKYIDALNKLRSHPFMRDFEVIPQKLDGSAELPEVYFDATFVDFFKDNYSRIVRAIDREPELEVSVITNGVSKGISREMVDTLRAQVEEKERSLEVARVEKESLNQQLGQEQADHRRSKAASAAELARIRNVNEALQRAHEDEIKKFETQQQSAEAAYQRQVKVVQQEAAKAAEALRAEHRLKEEEFQRQFEYMKKTAEAEAARVQRRAEAEMADLRATISRLEVDIMKANKAKSQELQAAQEDHASKLAAEISKTVAEAAKAKKVEARINELEKQVAEKEDEVKKTRGELREKEEEKSATQTELDDLLMVFSDLEDKAEKYKKRLLGLGQTLSDAEDDDEEDEEEEEEGEVD